MSKIGLRVYLREIENLIDRGQLDEAQAHCKHILSLFPKQLDSYRLLGKSLLEAQRFVEAEDLLQRVLSSVPDDFIAQIGMSMIREEEANLDAAIWHMERAYEVQPSNPTIMTELKRLYGRRDGVEPQKIRLTRGALVRMYARTNLFPQAIAEARAALEEDVNRIDLQIILARLLLQTNQKVEASELCSRIITKYPFCLEANRILSEILPETSKAEEAKVFHDRVIALDPYTAFTSSNTPTSDLVPENAVQIDRLENFASTPTWSLRSQDGLQPSDSPQPDWLRSMISEQPATSETISPDQNQQPIDEKAADIPDWMHDAGWAPSKGVEEKPTETTSGTEIVNESPIPADIPDWLKNIQPEQDESSKPVEQIKPEEEKTAESVTEVPHSEKTDRTPGEGTPDWITTFKSEAKKPEQTATAEPVMTIPGANASQTEETEQHILEESEKAASNLPFSLDEIPKTESSPAAIPMDENAQTQQGQKTSTPNDWLEESSVPLSSGKTGPILPSVELPEWLKEIEITPEGDESLKAGKTGPIQESDILPDWLKDFQTPQETVGRPVESRVEPEKMVEPEPLVKIEPEKLEPEPVIEPVKAFVPEPQVELPAAQSPDADLNQWLTQMENETSKPVEPDLEPKTEELQEKAQPVAPVIETPVFEEEKSKVVKINEPKSNIHVESGSSILELQELKEDLDRKDLTEAYRKVNNLIRTTSLIDGTINQLLTAQSHFISEAQYWQMLGDAFKKKGNFRKALESYNKAEDLCQ